jgi:2-oxo-3-hexenedioate decarboxylase/2-keto-4-pentenoate hydratase
MTRARRAAEFIVNARLAHQPLGALPVDIRPRDEQEGYAAQQAARPLLTAAGFGELAGYKVGCTSRAMQEFLGIPTPCAGSMFSGSVHDVEGSLPHDPGGRLGFECEIAVWIGADLDDLDDRPDGYARGRIVDAIEASCAAIEVVADRYVDYASLGVPTLIADDFFHVGCVVGPKVTDFDPNDLRSVRASMEVDGEHVGSGTGADLLDDPINVLSWLAGAAASRRDPLRAGQVVMLGSIVATRWVDPSTSATAVVSNDPLGQVVAHIG